MSLIEDTHLRWGVIKAMPNRKCYTWYMKTKTCELDSNCQCLNVEEELLQRVISPTSYLLEHMMATNHTLFEEDRVFGFHVKAYHLKQVITECMISAWDLPSQ